MSTCPVVRDLMRKCQDDVVDTIHRTALLALDRDGAATIALGGAAAALGTAAGAVAATCDEAPTAEEATDALWQRFRPMVIRAYEQLEARKRAA